MSQLVIVESPTKAKTIGKFLPKSYIVKSSFGHIRDLPKKEMGVDVQHHFKPTYVIPKDKQKTVTELKEAAKKAELIYFATDADREGEAIAWHLLETLKPKKEAIKRITFHEITKSAIEDALNEPRSLDMDRVDAQQARRILDRLVGYELSPFLWKKVARGLSAGRVQSVAVRLIVEREREIQAFKPKEYWTIDAIFNTADAKEKLLSNTKDLLKGFFEAKLFSIDGKSLSKFAIPNEKEAKTLELVLRGAAYTISRVEMRTTKKRSAPPFTTSTLQQEANRKLGFSSRQTMRIAQQLYEGVDLSSEGSVGLITYMRTDSVNLSSKFTSEAHDFIAKEFGASYALSKPRAYKTKSRTAQEAHEAIRPTEASRTPESVKGDLTSQQFKLYNLIWRRALAAQMQDAQMDNTSVDIAASLKKRHIFRATGQTIRFDGFLRIYPYTQNENLLPHLTHGQEVAMATLTPSQHFTEPPARYSDASLVKVLEENEIGRPSTYAPTISTIIDRGYVERIENRRLKPTDMAFVVNDVLVEHFPEIIDYDFTAELEKELDQIAEGKLEWEKAINDFYAPFHKNLEKKEGQVKRKDIMKERVVGTDPKTGLEVIARIGRFGSFVQLGVWSEEDKKAKKNKPNSASLEEGQSVDTITLKEALRLLELPRLVGQTKNHEDIIADIGRFGAYLRAGNITVSLPDGHDPRAISLEECRVLLEEAAEQKKKMLEPIAELGEDPATSGAILVKNGRFGPYITDGKTNVSLGKKLQPEDVTRDMAIEMLEKKRKAPKRAWRRKK